MIKKLITLIRNFIRVRIAALLTFFQAMFYFYRRTLCTALSCFRVKIRENTAVYRLQSTDYDGKRQNICPM